MARASQRTSNPNPGLQAHGLAAGCAGQFQRDVDQLFTRRNALDPFHTKAGHIFRNGFGNKILAIHAATAVLVPRHRRTLHQRGAVQEKHQRLDRVLIVLAVLIVIFGASLVDTAIAIVIDIADTGTAISVRVSRRIFVDIVVAVVVDTVERVIVQRARFIIAADGALIHLAIAVIVDQVDARNLTVGAGAPLYEALLQDSDPRTAIAATYILAYFPAHAFASCKTLLDIAQNKTQHDFVRSSALISCSYLGGGTARPRCENCSGGADDVVIGGSPVSRGRVGGACAGGAADLVAGAPRHPPRNEGSR